MSSEEKIQNSDKKDSHSISLIIKTTLGTWTNSFEKTAKVKDVVQAVIQHFGFSENGNYELRMEKNPDEVLNPERTLVSYHLQDEDIVIFTDLGVAV